MAIGRRGFLKALGKGAAVGAAMATPTVSYAVGVDHAKPGSDKTFFNFGCPCGNNLAAEVPDTIGKTVNVKCDCGTTYEFQWRGDHFATHHLEKPPQAFADDEEENEKLRQFGHI